MLWEEELEAKRAQDAYDRKMRQSQVGCGVDCWELLCLCLWFVGDFKKKHSFWTMKFI
jgi:hypothetical protein